MLLLAYRVATFICNSTHLIHFVTTTLQQMTVILLQTSSASLIFIVVIYVQEALDTADTVTIFVAVYACAAATQQPNSNILLQGYWLDEGVIILHVL